MSNRRIAVIAFVTAFGWNSALPVNSEAKAHDPSISADLVVQGRVLEESSEALPQKGDGFLILRALWTYRVRIDRVLRGEEQRKAIIARNEADPALRKDVDFVFYLHRSPDGSYKVIALSRVR